MFGPERTATSRSPTSVESRAPVAGSQTLREAQYRSRPRERGDDVPVDRARNRDDDELGVCDRRLPDGGGSDPSKVGLGDVARIATVLADCRDLVRVAGSQRDVVPAVAQQAANAEPHDPAPTTTTLTRT